MNAEAKTAPEAWLLSLVPADGAAIGNQTLRDQFLAQASGLTEADFERLKDALIAQGVLVRGKGRGGSVRRAAVDESPVADDGFTLAPPEKPETPAVTAKPKKPAPAAPRGPAGGEAQILSYRHPDKRKNNPEVGMVTPATDPAEGKSAWRYDPHLDPELQFDPSRARIENLIDDALASDDKATLRTALEELKRLQSPYLNWAGKAERTRFEVDTVSLHVHERIDPMSILAAVRKSLKEAAAGKKGSSGAFQYGLFDAPFESLPLHDAIDFYRHERGWANRLIAGDSLLVMNSLLQKESQAGRVQMIYIDPPYGIKYGSNFQPFVNKRDVKDHNDADLTQEPEMIKAFRDTWELGIHSYLTYLRDRLLLAKDLLHESGSVFVQISDENSHLVRNLLDEVFGPENFGSLIAFQKTTGSTTKTIPRTSDYLLWYGRNIERLKFKKLYLPSVPGLSGALEYKRVQLPGNTLVPASRFSIDGKLNLPEGARLFATDSIVSKGGDDEDIELEWAGKKIILSCKPNRHWKPGVNGIKRLWTADRLLRQAGLRIYKRFFDDFPYREINHIWADTRGEDDPDYVVQTHEKVVERCLLMTTDPGDLVLDPTCGSGTTAFVAERWGRRWITCDTSRVAVTLAKQRLMTASYDYYELRYPLEGLKGGFIYKTVPHVTLKSIANNPEIDEIYERMHPAIETALAELNAALAADREGLKILEEWEVPFDFPDDGPDEARAPFDAFHAARQAMQRKMDASIAAHADQETLYDQPAAAKNKRRITGPFTVEAVPFPTVLALDEAEQPAEADASVVRSGESARQHRWRDELLKTGIRGKGGQMLKFAELETLPDTLYLHASGHLRDGLDTPGQAGLGGERVVVSFGPEHAALEQRQVTNALNEAGNLFPLPKMIVFCAFAFDPEAAKDIDSLKGIVALKAQMNTDLLTEDLKKGRAQNQSFWLMGQPDVEVKKRPDGTYQVEVHGFDYFDTAKGELVSGGKGKIALWLLDTDYDERSLFPRQVFFPMAGKGEGWEKLKKDIRAELNETLLSQFHGTVSLPFEAGDNRKIAVKIVDDRGIESLKVIPLV
jgi:adenine-specific DNA-methyltransferase